MKEKIALLASELLDTIYRCAEGQDGHDACAPVDHVIEAFRIEFNRGCAVGRWQAYANEAQHWEDLLRPGAEVSGSEIKARLWMMADNQKEMVK